jgi:hypothetical protein
VLFLCLYTFIYCFNVLIFYLTTVWHRFREWNGTLFHNN